MTSHQRSGLCLIAGALIGALIMLYHPTGHDILAGSGADTAAAARRSMLVHALAIFSAPLSFYGLLGLTRRLGATDLGVAAQVGYGCSTVAAIGAALASGFVATPLAGWAPPTGNETQGLEHLLLAYTGLWNQGFARVYVVAGSLAILLWSLAIWRTRRLPAWAGGAGLLASGFALAGFLSGHLALDVHGFGWIVFAQSAWLIVVGLLLCRIPRES